jgi:hypothetical protein
MKHRFEVDKVIIGKTTDCKYNFDCLEGDFPEYEKVMQGVESVLCRFGKEHFCHYRFEIVKRTPVCICYVRNEIHRKYKS